MMNEIRRSFGSMGQASSGGFVIGSFNVQRFQSEGASGNLSYDDRQAKAKHIAEIIRSENFAITCLQECFREKSNGAISPAERITSYLNGGLALGRYACIHCSRFYDVLKDYGYKFRSLNESRGEYAFIWDTTKVTLAIDKGAMVVYNAINERLTRGLDAAITAGLATMLLVGGVGRQKSDKEEDEERKRLGVAKNAGKMMEASAVAGVAYAANHKIAGSRKERIAELLRSSLRPPFVGLFNMKYDKNKQIRLINVHTQWGKIKGESISGEEARKIEMRYLVDIVFPTVDTQRSGFNETVYTVMAGDYNYSAESLMVKSVMTKYGANIRMVQHDSTKWYLSNPVEVEERRQLPIYKPIPGHDYDHFVVSRPCWSDGSGTAIHHNEDYFVGEGYGRCPISDHYPVRLSTPML